MKGRAQAYFISATDTDAGKTLVTCALLKALLLKGHSIAGLKPLAAGGRIKDGVLQNDDALLLQEFCSPALSYAAVNPFCLQQAIAPHIAAAREGKRIELAELLAYCRVMLELKRDYTLIEGAGGWQVSINGRESLPDLVRALDIPVLLVVGMKLGCLNHAMLTLRAMQADGVRVSGWIANQLQPAMPAYAENLQTLQEVLPVPLLAEMPWQQDCSPAGLSPLQLAWEKLEQ